jgi:hypothetical protein
MRMPDLTDKVKDVPVRALRAVFAGLGQLLTAAERMRSEDHGSDLGSSVEEQPRSEARDRTGGRSLDSTGNVRLLTPEELAASAMQAASDAQAAPAAQAAPDRAGLPLPGYDGLSVASLRARLRMLDVDQLGMLIEYEKSNAGRDDVVAMFERRIAKLSSGAA